MKNPLNKRIVREFTGDFGKYIVIFLFMVMLIGIVSGFEVAENSIAKSYNDGFEKFNIEDGHILVNRELPQDLISSIETENNLKMYEMNYFEELIDGTKKNVRVYHSRTDINLETVMEGKAPEKADEIALDRLFARNSEIEIGDTIKLNGKSLKVVGIVALPDYSCLFEKNTDMMFDSINFGVGVMTGEGYEAFASRHETIDYAWDYNETIKREDKKAAKLRSDDLIENLKVVIEDYDETVIKSAIDDSKVVFAYEIIGMLDKQLKEYGMDISMYENEEGYQEVLSMINEALEGEGVRLYDEFVKELSKEGAGSEEEIGDLVDKDIAFTVDDVKLAMSLDKDSEKELEKKIENVGNEAITVKDYLPRYLNQAINFTGDDLGGDEAMIIVFGYIVIVIIAFVFAVTTLNTITQEAGVIGTLRASGYSKGELIRHYMVLPVATTLIAGIAGNILGYTWFKNFVIDLEYNSYSFGKYETLWNSKAFIITTIIPIILMFVINLWIITSKLKLSPLRFLRRDLSKRGKKKAFRLNTKIRILNRFRLRIIFQNIPNYLVLFFGIFVGGVVIVFGTMFGPLLDDYKDLAIETRIADYQYVMMEQVETSNSNAEKFAMTGLKYEKEGYVEDDISVYGIVENSKYVKTDIAKGKVVISSSIAEKYNVKTGDTVTLKDGFTDEKHEFVIEGIYTYDGALAVFMNIDDYRSKFNESETYFTGYFSNEEIDDIDSDDIYTIITVDDLTKASDQLLLSMGKMMNLLKYFGIIMFLLLMYILSKQIIEKNAQSISMTKILGYSNAEIGSLYIISTTMVVIVSMLISIPVIKITLDWMFGKLIYKMMAGYIPNIISSKCYLIMILCGIGSYALVAVMQMIKINKIPKSDALKSVE